LSTKIDSKCCTIICREEVVEVVLKKQKELYTKHKLQKLREADKANLDSKSQPIR
jgi:adenylate kinase